jgi:hypothetical protein
VATVSRRHGQDRALAEILARSDEACSRAAAAQAVRDESLARQLQEEFDTQSRGGRPTPRGSMDGRVLAPGRTARDPVPMKMDAAALKKLREDVFPFLLQRVGGEQMQIPPMHFEMESAVGTIQAFYQNVAVSIGVTEDSRADIAVSADGIQLKLCNIEAHMHEK